MLRTPSYELHVPHQDRTNTIQSFDSLRAKVGLMHDSPTSHDKRDKNITFVEIHTLKSMAVANEGK